MPLYTYEHPETGEVKEILQGMADDHVYTDESKTTWRRVFTSPNAAIDTRVDPYSSKDFVKATDKRGTIGDLVDRSTELSEKRKDKDGVDNVTEKYYSEWSKKRNGKIHPDKAQENFQAFQKSVSQKIKDKLG